MKKESFVSRISDQVQKNNLAQVEAEKNKTIETQRVRRQKGDERIKREETIKQSNLLRFQKLKEYVDQFELREAMAALAQLTVGRSEIIELPYDPSRKPVLRLAFVLRTKEGAVYETTGKRIERSVRCSDGWSSGWTSEFVDQVRPSAPKLLQDEFQLHVSLNEIPGSNRYLSLEFNYQHWRVENKRFLAPDVYRLSSIYEGQVPGGRTSISIGNEDRLSPTLDEFLAEGYEFLSEKGLSLKGLAQSARGV